jgi:hypothetical protein
MATITPSRAALSPGHAEGEPDVCGIASTAALRDRLYAAKLIARNHRGVEQLAAARH